MIGNNTPVFFVRDAIKFPDFIHTQKREPQTNLRSETMMWDFWSQVPESLHSDVPKQIPRIRKEVLMMMMISSNLEISFG